MLNQHACILDALKNDVVIKLSISDFKSFQRFIYDSEEEAEYLRAAKVGQLVEVYTA